MSISDIVDDFAAKPGNIPATDAIRSLLRSWRIGAGLLLVIFLLQLALNRFENQSGPVWLWVLLVTMVTPAALGAALLIPAVLSRLSWTIDRAVSPRYLKWCRLAFLAELILLFGIYFSSQIWLVEKSVGQSLHRFDPLVGTTQVALIVMMIPLFPMPAAQEWSPRIMHRRLSPPENRSPAIPNIIEAPPIVSDIPGNQFAFDRLNETLSTGQAIAFVGAGASAGLYPLWASLTHELAEQAKKRGKAGEADVAYWLGGSSDPLDIADSIRGKLGNELCGEVIREIFQPDPSKDRRFTPIHFALVRLPFKGLLTTNYDAGLEQARATLGSDLVAGDVGTWKDQDFVRRWQTGEIFGDQTLPIFHAHGVYDRSDTIVLGREAYRAAYKTGRFRDVIEQLWASAKLVFVGFSFADAYLEFLADGVVAQDVAGAAGKPRHVALIGLPPGKAYSPEMRNDFQRKFDAEVVFYPVKSTAQGRNDHSELQAILEGLIVASA